MFKRIQLLLFAVVIAAALYFLNMYWDVWILPVVSLMLTLSVILIGFVIFLENRKPSQTLNWLMILAAFPVVGFFFYLLFGQNYRKRKMFKQKAELDEKTYKQLEKNRFKHNFELNDLDEHQRNLFNLAQNVGNSAISFHTETEVLTNGSQAFPRMIEELKRAKHHIHLEFYIVRHDELGKEIKDVLVEKAKNGIEVRFLYDAVGSWQLSLEYKEELRDAGVELIPFLPVKLPFFSNKINFRNHRKIIVIDGTIGFVGGLNIGDEYIGRNKYFGNWRDTHLFVKGEGVRSLQMVFLQDWFYMTGKTLLKPVYLTPDNLENDIQGGFQLIAGGPDSEWETLKMLFFSMIMSAQKSIWIASPYFVPDEDILSALKIASLSGIDVRLLVPNRPDKKIVYYASQSYYPELMEAGIRIYQYKKGFMHSKILIVDNELASIGTSNMDMRSFHLNFEVNAFLYRTESTKQLVDDFLIDIKNSAEIEFEKFKNRSIFMRMYESTCRLLSPLL